MRHMGNSGKFALIAAVAALGMLVLTAITLEEAVAVTFLGLVALAYVAAVAEVLARGRRLALLATGAGTSLSVAFSLAFISTWELAFADQSSFLGTPLPTGDPDNYFYWAAASAVATVLVLFLGATWPAGKRPGAPRRKPSPAKRRPAPGARRPAARGTTTQRPAPQRAATQRASTQRVAAQRAAAKGTSAQRTSGQGTSGSRVPVRLPAAAAKRPPSSVSGDRKPAPKAAKPGNGRTSSRR
jgi:hypothetical protein